MLDLPFPAPIDLPLQKQAIRVRISLFSVLCVALRWMFLVRGQHTTVGHRGKVSGHVHTGVPGRRVGGRSMGAASLESHDSHSTQHELSQSNVLHLSAKEARVVGFNGERDRFLLNAPCGESLQSLSTLYHMPLTQDVSHVASCAGVSVQVMSLSQYSRKQEGMSTLRSSHTFLDSTHTYMCEYNAMHRRSQCESG